MQRMHASFPASSIGRHPASVERRPSPVPRRRSAPKAEPHIGGSRRSFAPLFCTTPEVNTGSGTATRPPNPLRAGIDTRRVNYSTSRNPRCTFRSAKAGGEPRNETPLPLAGPASLPLLRPSHFPSQADVLAHVTAVGAIKCQMPA